VIAAIRRHFERSERHGTAEEIWNYLYVPESYTYLRTNPLRIMEAALIDGFVR
jgi:hypothetical protein